MREALAGSFEQPRPFARRIVDNAAEVKNMMGMMVMRATPKIQLTHGICYLPRGACESLQLSRSCPAGLRTQLEEHICKCRRCRVVLDHTGKMLKILVDVEPFEVPLAVSAETLFTASRFVRGMITFAIPKQKGEKHMKNIAMAIALSLVMWGASSLAAQKQQTITGEVMDSSCAKMGSHEMMEKQHNMPSQRGQ